MKKTCPARLPGILDRGVPDVHARPLTWGIALMMAVFTANAQPMPKELETEKHSLALAFPDQLYQLALEARTERDYPRMLALLRSAATRGDRDAQELLAGILLAGSTVYGPKVKTDFCEAAYWIAKARERGSIAADNQTLVLNNMHSVRGGRKSCEGKSFS
ncbi:sel1 repeat family protein [Ottowia thiooxydans]|uniref:TPR repeat protein n=1 Tax=Ottowia thiooxydans TaxID=219182 RepID=A0ABV2Q2M2_9BURK